MDSTRATSGNLRKRATRPRSSGRLSATTIAVETWKSLSACMRSW